jgi:hypothetical protein
MAIDKEEFFDAIWDIVSGEATTVFSLGWDGDFPGGSGGVYVNEWKGVYFVTSSDYDDEGPFSSLEEALELDYFASSTPKPELSSNAVSEAKLKEIARALATKEGDKITINGRRFVLQNGEFCSV